MTIDKDIKDINSSDPESIFTMTELSRSLLGSIEDLLADLVDRTDLHPSDNEFHDKYMSILELYDRFQNELLDASGIRTACAAGCSNCCCHWVEDVNSFEAVIINRYLSDHYPSAVDSIKNSFRKDEEVMSSLRIIVDEKIAEYASDSEDIPDPYDLLLSCFYQLDRPCALLDDNGCCIVYPVRPLTCRDYLNLHDPAECRPDRINEEENATLILYLSDKVSELLEILHRRFDQGNDDMALRHLLAGFPE